MKAVCVLLLGVAEAGAWTTVAQTFYGAQYENIQLALNFSSPAGPELPLAGTGRAYYLSKVPGLDALSMLSHVWHYPKAVDAGASGFVPVVDGLGGGIAWAWDPYLCDDFLPLFKEDIAFVNLIDCNELKQAFARALSSWSNNHRFINFLDVSEECARIAQDPPYNRSKAEAWSECPYLEMWVTGIGTANALDRLASSSGDIADGIPIAVAEMSSRYIGMDNAEGRRPMSDAQLLDEAATASGQKKMTEKLTADELRDWESYSLETQLSKLKTVFDPWGEGPVYSESTSCINGETLGCFAFSNGIEIRAQDMLEIYHVQISFGTDSSNCWYLDSFFCSGFHAMKAGWSPSTVKFTVLLLCLIVMIIATFLFLGKLRVFGSCHRRAKRLKKGKNSCSVRKRCSKLYEEASKWSVIGTTLQLIFIILPPIMYTQIFVVCFDCYDFEGAAVHEIGHALGLGHPNTARDEVARERVNTNEKYDPGDNVYQSLFENGGSIDSNTCLNPWMYVKNNTPPGAELDKNGCKQGSGNSDIPTCVGIRNSVMEAFSQNNPSVCITEDDLEAVQTIYPDCDLCVTKPVCYRTRLNLGLVRIAVYILMPLIFIMGSLLIFQNFIASSTQEELDELNDEIDDVQKALAKKNKQVVVGRWVTGAKAAKPGPRAYASPATATRTAGAQEAAAGDKPAMSMSALAKKAAASSSSAGPSTNYEAPYEEGPSSSSKPGPRFDRM